MVTKFEYYINEKGLVARKPEYTFTSIESLSARLKGIDNKDVIDAIANTTLKGETERTLITIEDEWFKVQTKIQDMDIERKTLEERLTKGDKNGNPLTPEMQKNIAARIAELKEGSIKVKKSFYNHYTRQTMTVDEVNQTPYTIELERRKDLEAKNPFLAGLRGVDKAAARPKAKLDIARETFIRKELVRQHIGIQIGDDKDLIADMSNALSALIKKVSGVSVTADEDKAISKYIDRQTAIATILAADYRK